MKNVRGLVQEINEERPREFDAFKVIDNNFNELLNRVKKLEERNLQYYVKCWRGNVQSIPTGVYTDLIFLATIYPQLGNMHDNTSDPDAVYIRRSGIYSISATVLWEADAVGRRDLNITLDRDGVVSILAATRDQAPGAVAAYQDITTSFYCYLGDIIRVRVLQTSGGPLNSVAVGPHIVPALIVTERREDLDSSQYGLLNPEANTF